MLSRVVAWLVFAGLIFFWAIMGGVLIVYVLFIVRLMGEA